MVRACGDEMDELKVGAGFWTWGERGQRDEDGGFFEKFWIGHSNQ